MHHEIASGRDSDLPALPQPIGDEMLIALWLHGRSAETQRGYRGDVEHFRRFLRKPLADVTLVELQAYADSLDATLQPASKHRRLSAIKSLYAYAYKIGYARFDVGRPLRLPVLRLRLAERILPEGDMLRMIRGERHPRNHALLLVLYASGIRVSECCSLRWNDLQDRGDGLGQITIFGKGGKTNTILLPSTVWSRLTSLREEATQEQAVFRSRRGRPLHPTEVRRIVRRAARRAGIDKPVSPHWLRHASASHALDRGAAIHVVQATLGHSSVSTTTRYLHARPSESSAMFLAI